MPSLLESLAGPEVPCAECLKKVPGLRWGELCPACYERLRQRASQVGRRISLVAALLAALWTGTRIPAGGSSRVWVVVTTLVVYLLVRRIAVKVAMEYYRSRSR